MIDPDLLALLDRVDSSRDRIEQVHDVALERMRAEVDAVVDEQRIGSAVPVVAFDEVCAGSVAEQTLAAVRRRGCVVVRGTFDRSQAARWDDEVAGYLTSNRFEERFAARYPDAPVGSKIWGIYWSAAQVAARQHPNMVRTREFLNSFWSHESGGVEWFDPTRDIGYPDRLRRRAPGVEARGLPPHSDGVSSGGWRLAENELVFGHLLRGDFDAYDPWNAAHRTTAAAESTAPSTVFRTFQGWTALSEMQPSDGVLHLVPIPSAAAYMLIRGIAGELGLLTGEPEPAPRRSRADELLLRALVPIPAVQPGDTVWWHGDVIHSVAPASNDSRWGNVMYIAATPGCPRNDEYQASMLDRFVSGCSPLDFPGEDFEVEFEGRAGLDALNDIGRSHFGLDPAAAT